MKRDIKYLRLLSKSFPTVQAACTEIINLEAIMNLSDRILVFFKGEIAAELKPEETTVQELGLYMAGGRRK